MIVCSNDNPGLTLTYFTTWANFANTACKVGNVTMLYYLEITAACGLEVG